MAAGTPTLLNELYECGFNTSLTLGSCNNSCLITGSNKFLSQPPQCSVGIANGISTQKETIKLSVFPNPTEGVIKIEGEVNSKDLKYEIFNLKGQMVQRSGLKELPSTIDITQLPGALYILKILDNNTIIFQSKLQKK